MTAVSVCQYPQPSPHHHPLLYPTLRLWSVSHVSPEQHSKMLDLQVTHCSCPCTTTVCRGDWHLGQRCLWALAGMIVLSIWFIHKVSKNV